MIGENVSGAKQFKNYQEPDWSALEITTLQIDKTELERT